MSLYDEAVEMLAALVAFPTESRTPNAALIDLVAELDARYPALHTSKDHLEVKFLADVIGRDCAGHLPFGCEAGLYAESLSVPAVVFGPGYIGDAHRPDEFVTQDQIVGACTALTAIIDAYCTPAGARSATRHATGAST